MGDLLQVVARASASKTGPRAGVARNGGGEVAMQSDFVTKNPF